MTETRRHAAGQDPEKRDQILNGAMAVFMASGFHTASMNDICRAAGVSKGTIYVYFSGKDDLFQAMVDRERDRLFGGLDKLLDGDMPLAEKLARYGTELAGILCSDQIVRAQRIVVATVDRMPEVGARFYDAGASRAHARLARLFEVDGTLDIADPALAAHQFIELLTAGLWRKRLFARMPAPPPEAEIARVVDAALGLFLRGYARRPAG